MMTRRLLAIGLVLGMGTATGRAGESFTRGDCNADGSIVRGTLCDIADAVFLLNYVFADGEDPPCVEACNVNGDPRIDIGDAVYLLSYCFSDGPVPAAPFPACGEAPEGSDCVRFPWCPEGCGPQDAAGVGPCDMVIGIFWDGERCAYVSGCTCEGKDCDKGYKSLEDCYREHAGCGSVCDPMDVRGVGDCEMILGWYWDGRTCRALSGCSCEGKDCDRLAASPDACAAMVAGCPPSCDPMDARPVGPCTMILGYIWDGKTCQGISGCACEGEDCDGIFQTLPACEAAYSGCK